MIDHPIRSMVSARRYILFGLAVLLLLVGGLGAWATIAQLSGAVISPGVVAVSSNRQTVQHLEGGIISALLVRDHEAVEAGQLLLKLDDTQARATLAIIDGRLDLLRAQAARLQAERDGLEAIEVPASIGDRLAEPAVREIIDGQVELFEARRLALDGETEILTQRIAQLEDEIGGLQAQQSAKESQIGLISEELVGLERLYRQGYAPRTRVLELQRGRERLSGEVGEHLADLARARTRIGETRLQIIQLRWDVREEAVEQLREVQAQIYDLDQRRAAALDELKRLDIYAPVAGAVVGLSVHTVGGVAAPGQPLMDIVPEEDELVIEAQIAPTDIDKIAGGLPAVVRLSAFNLRTTPELNGTVFAVSADRLVDETRGFAYYQVGVRIPESELARLEDLTLLPGMPAEVFINTGERSALSYLVKPLADSLAHVFREE